MQLTKDNVLRELPETRDNLVSMYCPTQRHVRRLESVLNNLLRRDLIEAVYDGSVTTYSKKIMAVAA